MSTGRSAVTAAFALALAPVTGDAASAADPPKIGKPRPAPPAVPGSVYLPPAQFEAAFVSLAHGEREIDETIAAAAAAFRESA